MELLQGKATENNNSKKDNTSVIFVENIFPKLLRLGSTGQSHVLDAQPKQNVSMFSSIYLNLNKVNRQELYWTYELLDQDQTSIFDVSAAAGPNQSFNADSMVVIVYNEEVIGSILGNLNLSVVGLYATIVIAIGRFIRLIFDRIS